VMIFGSVASIYYYFAWMRASLETAEGGERKLDPQPLMYPTITALAASTIILGVAVLYRYGL